jgi:hypothetical protein
MSTASVPSPDGPINPRLPDLAASLGRKYTSPNQFDRTGGFGRAAGGASPMALRALHRLDTQRVQRGQSPLGAVPSALGLQAATTGQSVLPEPDQPFFVDLATDVADFARAIPQLPFTIFDEARQLPESLGNIGQEYARGGGGIEGLGNVANLPGLRLVPGSFIAGQFGTDQPGVEGLANHPLFTLLDAAPFAGSAVRHLSPTYKLTAQLAQDQAAALQIPTPRAPRPLQTLARYGRPGGVKILDTPDLRATLLDQQGTVPKRGWGALTADAPPVPGRVAIPNRYGQIREGASRSLRSTPIGRYASEAFSTPARTIAERSNYYSSYLQNPSRMASISPEAAGIFEDARRAAEEANISPEREAQIVAALTTDDAPVLNTLAPHERTYIDQIKAGQDVLRQVLVERGDLVEVPFAHGAEVYDRATGDRLLKGRRARDEAEWFAGRLREHVDGSFGDAPAYWAEIRTILDDPALSTKAKVRAVDLNLRALERQGIGSVAPIRRAWADANTAAKRASWERDFYTPVTPDMIASLPRNPIPPGAIDDAIAALRASGRNAGPLARDLFTSLRSGNWQTALQTVVKMEGTRRYADLGLDLPTLRRALDDRTFIEGGSVHRVPLAQRVGDLATRAEALARSQERLERATPPARFDDLIRREAGVKIGAAVVGEGGRRGLTPETLASTVDALAANLYSVAGDAFGDVGWLESQVRQLRSEARRSWQDLAARGLDPKYVHRVTPEAANRMANPRVLDNPSLSPSQIRQRLWDPSPSVSNLAISLQHQAFEFLNAEASRRFATEAGQWFGVSGLELEKRYLAAAKIAHERNPSITRDAHLRQLIDRDWATYDPAKFLRGKGEKPRSINAANQTYIPRVVASTLDRLRPIAPSSIEQSIAPVMNVFRTSLLPLSLRWHLYNILGGAVMMMAGAGPSAFRYLSQAKALATDGGRALGEVEVKGSAMPPGGHMRQAQEWFQSARLHDPTGMKIAHQLAAGNTLGRIMAKMRDNPTVGRVSDAMGRGVQKSYDFNQYVDNMYRSMAYLSGEAKAIKRGMTEDQAIAAGMSLSRDILQSWDRLTPLERSTMRLVAPFYGWLSHLLRFTVKNFPHDHPWRLGIMARVAETEMSDYATGLPSRLASLFTPFGMDADGNVTAIALDGANPFRDIANYALLAGFLTGQEGGNLSAVTSNLNPLLAAPLKAAGLDVTKGLPELYPELDYDPMTGSLRLTPSQSFPMALLTSVLPPARALDMLSGRNVEFRQMMVDNPDAARNMLLSSVGLPGVVKQYNQPEELIKSETRRYEDMMDVRSEALSTGDLGLMDKYPTLRAYRRQIETLKAQGQLGQYQPPKREEPSLLELLTGG